MRVLSTIVEPFVLTMLHSWQYLAFRGPITLQLISDDHAWHILQPFEQFPKESLGGLFVASALHQDIKHVPILINGSPYIVFLASYGENHLVHVPFVPTTRAAAAQLIGVGLPKFEAPLPDGFIGDDDSTLRQNFLNIAKTERETEIQPNSVTDNLRWETETFVVWRSSVCFYEAILAHCSVLLPS
jgi:hypothetical protein